MYVQGLNIGHNEHVNTQELMASKKALDFCFAIHVYFQTCVLLLWHFSVLDVVNAKSFTTSQ